MSDAVRQTTVAPAPGAPNGAEAAVRDVAAAGESPAPQPTDLRVMDDVCASPQFQAAVRALNAQCEQFIRVLAEGALRIGAEFQRQLDMTYGKR